MRHISVWSHSVLLSQPVPPIDQTQPELGVGESSDAVHGKPPLRRKSMAEKGREWNRCWKGGVVRETLTAETSVLLLLSHPHHSVLTVVGLQSYSRAVIKDKQEKRERVHRMLVSV